MNKAEKKILYKIHNCLHIRKITNPCAIDAITDYINESYEKLDIVRKIIMSLIYKNDIEIQSDLKENEIKLDKIIDKYK